MIECTLSPTGQHEYNPNEYGRDDMGFYCDCIHCGKTLFIPADTHDEFESIFGLNDEDRNVQ